MHSHRFAQRFQCWVQHSGGFVTNKTNIRFAWGISLAITAVACFFWGGAQSSTIYFVCLAVSTVCGMAFCYIANMNVISNWFPKKKGIAMGWVTIGFRYPLLSPHRL